MKLSSILSLAAAVSAAPRAAVDAQRVGSQPEVHPSLPSHTCTAAGGCTAQPTKIVLDANFRSFHNVGGTKNCFSYVNYQWDTSLCPDPATCARNCVIEGANYAATYSITTSGSDLTLGFLTKGPPGEEIGSRVYLMENDDTYKMFKLLNQEFTFDVDASQLACGLNGALYFVAMDADGGKSKYPGNTAGARYGTGYCDAQCPTSNIFVNGEANTKYYGSCCTELDIWEANKVSTAFNSHPCTVDGPYRCTAKGECGDDASGNRYNGVCAKDGCEFNAYRMNNRTFYGPGPQFTIDTTQPITVVTQFITDDKTANGNLVEIKRLYRQNGRTIPNAAANWGGIDAIGSLTDALCAQTKRVFGGVNDHETKGKLARMGAALKRGVVLAMSLWVDPGSYMLWLDSTFPVNGNPAQPGVARGSCPTSGGRPADLVRQVPGAYVKFSNIRVGDIGSTTPAPAPTPAPTPDACAALDNAGCDRTFFCTWNALAAKCRRWW